MDPAVLIASLYVFALAAFLGYQVISRVPPLLHTPLMSATNAISGISLIGSLVIAGMHKTPISNFFKGHLDKPSIATLLGFIAVLEGTPPDVPFFEATADRIGVPRKAFSNLLLHGKLDPQHRDDLDNALDALPLTEEHHSLMGISAFHTISLLTRVVSEAVQ